MRISGVTFVARKRSKKTIFFLAFVILLLVAVLAATLLSLLTGWPWNALQSVFSDVLDTIMSFSP